MQRGRLPSSPTHWRIAKETHSPSSLHGASARPAGKCGFLSIRPSPFGVVARLSRPQARRPRPPAARPWGGRRGRDPGASPVRADCLGLGQSSRPAASVWVAEPCCAPRPVLGAGLVHSRCPSAGWAPGAAKPRTVSRLRRVAGLGRRQGNEGRPGQGGGGVGPGRGREGARLGPRTPWQARG